MSFSWTEIKAFGSPPGRIGCMTVWDGKLWVGFRAENPDNSPELHSFDGTTWTLENKFSSSYEDINSLAGHSDGKFYAVVDTGISSAKSTASSVWVSDDGSSWSLDNEFTDMGGAGGAQSHTTYAIGQLLSYANELYVCCNFGQGASDSGTAPYVTMWKKDVTQTWQTLDDPNSDEMYLKGIAGFDWNGKIYGIREYKRASASEDTHLCRYDGGDTWTIIDSALGTFMVVIYSGSTIIEWSNKLWYSLATVSGPTSYLKNYDGSSVVTAATWSSDKGFSSLIPWSFKLNFVGDDIALSADPMVWPGSGAIVKTGTNITLIVGPVNLGGGAGFRMYGFGLNRRVYIFEDTDLIANWDVQGLGISLDKGASNKIYVTGHDGVNSDLFVSRYATSGLIKELEKALGAATRFEVDTKFFITYPHVVTGTDETIYVVGRMNNPQGLGNPSHAIFSEDGGETWSLLENGWGSDHGGSAVSTITDVFVMRNTGGSPVLFSAPVGGTTLTSKSTSNIQADIKHRAMIIDPFGTIALASGSGQTIMVALCSSPYSSWSDITANKKNNFGVNDLILL